MPRRSPLTPIFRPKARYGSITTGAQIGVRLSFCGFMGGTASTQGTDSLHGGTASTVGTDVINANVPC